jgi:hypothetical protein
VQAVWPIGQLRKMLHQGHNGIVKHPKITADATMRFSILPGLLMPFLAGEIKLLWTASLVHNNHQREPSQTADHA